MASWIALSAVNKCHSQIESPRLNIFQHLTYLSEHMTAAEVPEFKGFLMQFIGKSDKETLDKLLNLFKDTCPFPETMHILVHLVETWPCDIYVKSVLNHLSKLSDLAPFWLKTLMSSIFNHKQGLLFFRQNMHLAPKEDLLKLFDLMEKDSPHHKKLIEKLRREVKNKKN